MIPLRDTQPSYSRPIVTVSLIAVNLLVYLFQATLDSYSYGNFIQVFGLVPDHFRYMNVFTSMFVHGGWMHVIFNMWFLWIYGDNVEDILGHAKFLVFYLLCGVAAVLLQVALNPYSRIPVVGASGAIAGVMGGYLIKFPHSRILTLVPVFVFFTTFEIPAVLILLYWFVLQIIGGAFSGPSYAGGGVAWFAHVGGFVAGMVLIKIIGTRDRFLQRADLQW